VETLGCGFPVQLYSNTFQNFTQELGEFAEEFHLEFLSELLLLCYFGVLLKVLIHALNIVIVLLDKSQEGQLDAAAGVGVRTAAKRCIFGKERESWSL
jgi:hypothetical protein